MSSALDKVIAIHNMNLPYEICEQINSYCFYDEYHVNVKNSKHVSHIKIKNSFCGHSNNGDWGQWWFCANGDNDTSIETQFQATYCSKCGNYVHSNNIDIAANRSICNCDGVFQVNQQVETDQLYWLDTESELDPIETAYAAWREDSYW
jgi:hypothetical protein